MRRGDEIAEPKVAHLRAQPVDRAGDLVAEDHRHADAAPEGAVAHHDVVEADAAGRDRDPDLARPRLARRHLGDAQTSGGPVLSAITARIEAGRPFSPLRASR